MLSNIFLLAGTAGLALAAPAPKQKRASGFTFFGTSESGAEFGSANIPGTPLTDYIFPDTSTIDTLIADGMNTFRIAFLMERLVPTAMTGTIDAAYGANLTAVVDHITAAGAYAVLDPHNYARYAGSIITSTSDFEAFWTTVATAYKSNSKVIFDCNNEPHDMPSTTITAELNQACIDGVRAAGATTQYIFVEGTSYTGAWTWESSGNSGAMGNLTDTEDKIVYEMHQYLDSDGSGTSETCVSATIMSERLAIATAWLKANNKKGVLGEFAGGVNAVCESAVTDGLDYLSTNSDVWMGALWWSAGPWWGTYMYSMEPTAGMAYKAYMSILKPYFPSASSATTPVTASSASVAAVGEPAVSSIVVSSTIIPASSTPKAESTPSVAVSEPTSPAVETTPVVPTSTAIAAPVYHAPKQSSTAAVKPTSSYVEPTVATPAAVTAEGSVTPVASYSAVPVSSATATVSSGGTVEKYYQCGGSNYTGATGCVSGSACTVMNDFYSQCI